MNNTTGTETGKSSPRCQFLRRWSELTSLEGPLQAAREMALQLLRGGVSHAEGKTNTNTRTRHGLMHDCSRKSHKGNMAVTK